MRRRHSYGNLLRRGKLANHYGVTSYGVRNHRLRNYSFGSFGNNSLTSHNRSRIWRGIYASDIDITGNVKLMLSHVLIDNIYCCWKIVWVLSIEAISKLNWKLLPNCMLLYSRKYLWDHPSCESSLLHSKELAYLSSWIIICEVWVEPHFDSTVGSETNHIVNHTKAFLKTTNIHVPYKWVV